MKWGHFFHVMNYEIIVLFHLGSSYGESCELMGILVRVVGFVWEIEDRYMNLKQWKFPELRQSQW